MNIYICNKFFFIRLIIFSIIIFVISSCNKADLDVIDEDINKFIDWVASDTEFKIGHEYVPVESSTLNSFIVMDDEYMKHNFFFNSKNTIIGAFVFENEGFNLDLYNDYLILVSNAQKYEKFNISIVSNVDKNKSSFLLDKIEEKIILNGTKEENINKIYKNILSKNILIKLIKN